MWKLECVRTNIYKELEIFDMCAGHELRTPTSKQRAPGLFESLASRLLEQWKSQSASVSDQYVVKIRHCGSNAAAMHFAARSYESNGSSDAGRSDPDHLLSGSALFLDETWEQISTKLSSHIQAAMSQPNYFTEAGSLLGQPDPLLGPTIVLAERMARGEDVSYCIDT